MPLKFTLMGKTSSPMPWRVALPKAIDQPDKEREATKQTAIAFMTRRRRSSSRQNAVF